MTASVPSIDIHEKVLKDINESIDRITFGAGREDARRRAEVARPQFQHILACDDDTATSVPAREWAAHLAPMYGAKVTVASVAPPLRAYDGPLGMGGYWPGMLEQCERVEAEMREHAEDTVRRLRDQGIEADAVTTVGAAAHELAEIARTHRADLLILGAKGGGPVSRVLLGSVAEAVSGRVDASLFIARTTPKAERLLAATDGSTDSLRAVATALAYASETGADLVVQHVIEYTADPAKIPPAGYLKGIIDKMTLPTPPRVRYFLDVGKPAAAIAERARNEDCDLIVMGARGLGRVRGALLGSVSHRVANTASSSVFLVRPATPE